MHYRNDKTGRKLSILGFGCMRLPRAHGRVDIAKTEPLILEAVERGVNYFDTAYVYAGSEEALGVIIEKNKLRDKIFIATKLPLFLCKTYADFDKFFNKSLERLKIEYADYYLMHMMSGPEQWKTLCEMGIEKWIDEKKASGQIRQLGFSFHGKREDYTGLVDARDWDFSLVQYNYLDVNNQAGKSGIAYAASKGLPVFVMEPLLGGRLANEKTMPDRVREILTVGGESPSFALSSSAALPLLSTGAPTVGLTPASRALRWIWDHEEVTLVLSGMNAQSQLDENIRAAGTMGAPKILPKAEHAVINSAVEAFNEFNKINCTGCGYCSPCQYGVNIPGSFAAYNLSFVAGLVSAMKTYTLTSGAALTAKNGLASSCHNCGECETHCPQSIPIPQMLKVVKKRMEPLWYTAAVSSARFFTKVKPPRRPD